MEEFPKHGLTNLQNKKNKKTQKKNNPKTSKYVIADLWEIFPFNIRCYIDKTNGPKRVNCHLEIEQQCQRYLQCGTLIK